MEVEGMAGAEEVATGRGDVRGVREVVMVVAEVAEAIGKCLVRQNLQYWEEHIPSHRCHPRICVSIVRTRP